MNVQVLVSGRKPGFVPGLYLVPVSSHIFHFNGIWFGDMKRIVVNKGRI